MGALLGCSDAIERLRNYLPKVGASEANVLITGETGTGKERIAEAIHAASPRRRAPLVRINCAAIPDGLLESELFGHERGAFTGAHAAFAGRLRQAQGGTVFLDEIGEMSLFAQAKILRVLEAGELSPVGSVRSIPLDVRFVAATNQDLEMLVARNAFRADLYYRINVARLSLPPLRERRDDIMVFFEHFVAEFNGRTGCSVGRARASLQAVLQSYEWPGNIRELRNLVQAVFIDPPNGAIGLEHLPDHFQHVFAQHVTLRPTERDRLISALTATSWNRGRAAEQLHWSRMTLYRKMTHYQIGSSPK